jgi:methionine-rich copper-binding protein CopC
MLCGFAYVLAVAAGTVGATGDAPALEAASFRHLTLQRSAPEKDASLAGPVAEVRLFFSEAPQAGATSVMLADASGAHVHTTVASVEETDAKQVFVRSEVPLPVGAYTVHWRTLAQDGHALSGEFGFRIAAE